MAPKLSHIKVFDEPYLFNREAQILADLSQRGAPVPRILSMDHVKKSITMDHDGTSLESAIEILPRSPSVHRAWLSRTLEKLVNTVKAVADQDVFHLDLACRNFLVNQVENGESEIRLIDFGLALSARLPLQKPLWVIPDTKLHHPKLVEALADDWRNFFRDSERAVAIYRDKGLPIPTQFVGKAFDIPLQAYELYWPRAVAADTLDERWCLVCHSFAELLRELAGRLMLETSEERFLMDYAQTLSHLEGETLAQKRLLDLPHAMAKRGGTPRPSAFTKAASADEPDLSEPRKKAFDDSSEGWSRWQWLSTPTALAILLANYAYIDHQYTTHSLVLSDLGFYAALLGLMASFIGLLSLLNAGLRPILFLSLLTMSTTQLWFGFEMASHGLGLGNSLVVGLGLLTTLGLVKIAYRRSRKA